MKRSSLLRHTQTMVLLPAFAFSLASIHTKALPAPRHDAEALKEKARATGSPADWKKVLRNAESRKDTAYMGLAYISHMQALANMQPSCEWDGEMRRAMNFLSATKQYDYYFALYNLWIDRLFSNKSYRKAQDEATQMYLRAKTLNQPIGMAMALRVQGQIFYKINMYSKAYAVLKDGMDVCEPYQNSLNAFTTAQDLCEWLFMTCLKLGKDSELLPLAEQYGEMLNYWSGKGWSDAGGHFPATYHSLRAIALLKAGRISESDASIRQARGHIRPDLPARAYEHFYEACSMLHVQKGEYHEAIACIDTLIEAHRYYTLSI